MAVNLVKPDPGDDGDDLADVVDLVAVEDMAESDEGAAAQPSRLRAWWCQVIEDAERNATEPRPRFMNRPELGAHHFFNRAGLATMKTGTLVIFRGLWTLTRCGWVLVLGQVRKGKGAKSAPAAADTGKTGDAAQTKTPAKGRGRKPAGRKKGTKKKTAASAKSSTGDVILGGLLIAGMGVMFVTKTVFPAVGALVVDATSWVVDHPVDMARGAGGVVIVFMVIAWIVGGVVGTPAVQEHEEDQDREVWKEAADAEAELPEDQDEDQGSGESEADQAGGEAPVLSPEEQAEQERIQVYEWVRESIKKPTGSGVAVHLRELWLGLQKEGEAGPSMADVRALLEGHQITIRDGVKAPASDKDGASRNRPGVHSDDLPQSFTPLPTPGSNLIRLLPTYQASDQQ
ncbi:hypothetical protein [Streptomyces tropicalis]|uniref:Uncharacterized protein n=1 Tax=Streptomyces tropicalis TaxID=3034234 RepID=A0ABT6AG10_9ACTN|nr:hypothetical protein [Streptomyces tropicalis]MDF3303306.1 hypothetical protein [Streptomyces tropicalis]